MNLNLQTHRMMIHTPRRKKAGIEVIEVSYKDIDSEHLAWVWWILSEKTSVNYEPQSSDSPDDDSYPTENEGRDRFSIVRKPENGMVQK